MYSSDFIVNFLLFVFQAGLTILSAFLIVSLLHGKMGAVSKAVLVFLYSYAVPIFLMTFLGAFGLLKYPFVLAALVLLNTILLCLKWKLKMKFEINLHLDWKILLVYSPLILFLIVKFITASQSGVVETDSLIYHIPFAAKWLQTGSIWAPYYTAYVGPLGYYPGNHELLSLFAFLPFNEDVLINLINFPLFIGFGVVLYALARMFGLGGWKAVLAPSVFLFAPMIIRQCGIPQNDLFFIFSLAVALYFAVRGYLEKDFSFGSLFPVGVALGLFMGTKSSGAVYSGVFLLIMTVVLLVHYRKKVRMYLSLPYLCGVAFLFGGFWYLRNWIYTGNPLFPLDVKIGGLHIFQGYDSFVEVYKNSSLIANFSFDSFGEVFESAILSMGPVVVVIVLAFFGGCLKRCFDRGFRVVSLFLLLIPVVFLLYLITPFSYSNVYPNIRYLLPFFLLCYAVMVGVLKRGYMLVYLLSLFGFLLIAKQRSLLEYINDYVFYDISCIWLALLIGVVAVGCFLLWKRWKGWGGRAVLLILIVFCFGLFFDKSFILREEKGYDSFIVFDSYIYNEDMVAAYKFIDKNVPEDAKIAYTRGAAHLSLYGKHWGREVDYININDCGGCIYHDFKDSKDSILRDPNEESWLENLAAKDKQYLVILSRYFDDSGGIPFYELEWAQLNPEKFELLFKQNDTYVYKIN